MSLKLLHFHFSYFSHLIFHDKNKEKIKHTDVFMRGFFNTNEVFKILYVFQDSVLLHTLGWD